MWNLSVRMGLYFNSRPRLEAHKIYCDKKVQAPAHCNSSSVSSLSFSCRGCEGKNLDASSPFRCQKVCDRRRNLAWIQIRDATWIQIAISTHLPWKSQITYFLSTWQVSWHMPRQLSQFQQCELVWMPKVGWWPPHSSQFEIQQRPWRLPASFNCRKRALLLNFMCSTTRSAA